MANEMNEDLRSASSVDLASFERLVRVETKLDAMFDVKSAEHFEFVKDIKDHEERIRALEKVWWKMAGVAAAVAALIASGASAVVAQFLN